MNVPFANLPAQYRALRQEIDSAIDAVLETGQYILGPAVTEFEREFARYHRAAECVAVGSGTEALHLALWAMGIGPGDRVITVPYTFFATVEAILLAGAEPVFADIEPETCTLDPAAFESAVKRTGARAVIPVHLYGHPARMDEIAGIAGRAGCEILEDAAQAHGARIGWTFVGSFGRAAAFSFYPSKNLGAFGEAGAVLTRDPALAARMRLLRDHGQAEKYRYTAVGHNYRMDGIQGAVLGVKLRHLDRWTERRREIAAFYASELGGVGDLRLPSEVKGAFHVYYLYVVRTAQRDRLRDHLAAKGIASALHYPVPLHLQDALRNMGHRPGDFPESERAAKETIALPLFAEMTDADAASVAAAVREFYL
jgi:dTDP-4-amino-4,6-dideoxygalactose transaminase